jgi:hypothetical protein
VRKEKKRRKKKREKERIVRNIFLVISIGTTSSGIARYISFILSLCQF